MQDDTVKSSDVVRGEETAKDHIKTETSRTASIDVASDLPVTRNPGLNAMDEIPVQITRNAEQNTGNADSSTAYTDAADFGCYQDPYYNSVINIVDPSTYSPMVYVVDNQKMVYSGNYPVVYDAGSPVQKKSSLPYAYVSRSSFTKPDFSIAQNKLKLYNYWIETTNPRKVETDIIAMFGAENIYTTKSLFFRKKNSYTGEKVILVSKVPQKPYKFINRINRTFSAEKRTVKSVLGDYIISPDCLFIVIAEKSIEYICNNYYRYHKNEKIKIDTLISSFRQKFTCISDREMENGI